ncbi:hypothetical protein TSTA_010380 [Talaromyces stipitatus ATCC 10500]|uniref:DUF4185 domain-containing protein n=1 Tax=Talaromyces stipitatus (strain ATCC 10500 / CBS 375.48 / QM 6759 / NRRL 1006) TaxID=441959 RepID=B8MG53_TALSN|nr:uncharacterized protein TSTA_010380 [Talaromyces stipitatus ATCC 10500]EED15920.1 hypothetical protein TSTA_010380 [Talaromyces stipitatus ATCC 10500]
MSPLTALASVALLGTRVNADFIPTVLGTPRVLGNVSDPTIDRDSCGSDRFGDRALWTCRDSQPFSKGVPVLPIYSSSSSWTDFASDSTPLIQTWTDAAGNTETGLLCSGKNNEKPFFPYPSDECSSNTAGACDDGTRYVLWPNSPPLVTNEDTSTGAITAYTWISEDHINGSLTLLNPGPGTILYEIKSDPHMNGDSTGLPTVTTIQENFWTADEMPYGVYGEVVVNDVAYLYGQNAVRTVGLAKVSAGSVADKSAYQYYVDGVDGTGVSITNAGAGGQGTFYYSTVWNLYVWIGQAGISVAPDFYITTAPALEGPWVRPINFYSADYINWSYTLQAHPGLLANSSENAIYLTYTINDSGYYWTPLVYVQWES